jgi:hypothetical protein
MLDQFEKLCNERIKPVIFSSILSEEETSAPEELTVVADTPKKTSPVSNPSTTADEGNLLDEDNHSKKEDNSGFQVFFQPKASSSNLSSELKMEIDRKLTFKDKQR